MVMQRILPVILLSLIIVPLGCSDHTKAQAPIDNKTDPCIHKKDTLIPLSFTADTTTSDFYQLLRFIESKGEFSRYSSKKQIDSSTGHQIILRKVLCPEQEFDSPMCRTILHNVFSIRYGFFASKSLKGNKGYTQGFSITQLNFTTTAAKDSALQLIRAVGWGDPLKKWNDYFIASGKTRIYILTSDFAFFSAFTRQYGKMIQTEWADKFTF
jgi:hypothetical protein